MAETTEINWTDATFNPWIGCQNVAPECDNCYAEAQNNHRKWNGGTWGPKSPRHRTSIQNWKKPLSWNRKAKAFFEETGRRQRVFCASLADVFDNAVDPAWRTDLFDLIRECDNLDWQLLTKRPQNMVKMLPPDWGDGWAHVWLGTSAGTKKTADRNIGHLLNTPAAVRFVSAEPMLGALDLKRFAPRKNYFMTKCEHCCWVGSSEMQSAAHILGDTCDGDVICNKCGNYTNCDEFAGLDWIICGGESGPNARPMHPDWARSLRDQCVAAGVPFFFKQWGQWLPGEFGSPPDVNFQNGSWMDINTLPDIDCEKNWCEDWATDDYEGHAVFKRVGTEIAGRLLDGRVWDKMPEVAG